MPIQDRRYFGASLGEAISTGAGDIAEGIERRYKRQREGREEEREIAKEALGKRQKEFETAAEMAKMGIKSEADYPQFSVVAEHAAQKRNLEIQQAEANVAKTKKETGLYGEDIEIRHITLPDGSKMAVAILQTKSGTKVVPLQPKKGTAYDEALKGVFGGVEQAVIPGMPAKTIPSGIPTPEKKRIIGGKTFIYINDGWQPQK